MSLLVAGAMAISACGTESTDEATAAGADTEDSQESSTFPQFTAATVDGGQLDFGSLEGRDTVLWFWAPW